MNDLRSQNRTLTPVPEIGPKTGEIVSNSTTRRARTRSNPLFESSRPAWEPELTRTDDNGMSSGRPSLERPFTPQTEEAVDPVDTTDSLGTGEAEIEAEVDQHVDEPETTTAETLRFPVSRDLRSMPVSASTAAAAAPTRRDDTAIDDEPTTSTRRDRKANAPASRPTKRRELGEEADAEDDKFPWHYQFDDDEPQELLAKSPLLSRAFRSSVG